MVRRSIPPFGRNGWLPPGHYETTWDEAVALLDGEPGGQRHRVLDSLLSWRDAAIAKNLHGLVILNGSFVSTKQEPGDFDLLFVYDDATREILSRDANARELTDYQACRRLGFIGDVFAFSASLVLRSPLFGRLDMFDFDRLGAPKGVIEVTI